MQKTNTYEGLPVLKSRYIWNAAIGISQNPAKFQWVQRFSDPIVKSNVKDKCQ